MSFKRHGLIVSKLRRKPCSFEELQDYLQLQSGISGANLTTSLRTFQRDIYKIELSFGIEIRYNASRRVYEIVEDENEDHQERLLESFEIFNALNLSTSLTDQVILEKRKPLGTENLHGLLHAVKDRRQVSFDYEKYSGDPVRKRTVYPVAVKEARNRWYLLAKDSDGGVVKSFGLDRIRNLEISSQKFDPVDYDPEAAYSHSFGIINASGRDPLKIILSFNPTQGKYVRSLPLHHSQQLILETDEEWRFEFFLRPTQDFIMEILSHGAQVKVLEPECLQNSVKKSLMDTLKLYDA